MLSVSDRIYAIKSWSLYHLLVLTLPDPPRLALHHLCIHQILKYSRVDKALFELFVFVNHLLVAMGAVDNASIIFRVWLLDEGGPAFLGEVVLDVFDELIELGSELLAVVYLNIFGFTYASDISSRQSFFLYPRRIPTTFWL